MFHSSGIMRWSDVCLIHIYHHQPSKIMIIKDDRTEEQKKTHVWGVVGRDSFLSFWGEARGGFSRAAWAAHPDVPLYKVEDHVKARPEMKYVNVVDLRTYRPPRGTKHFHIYVCNPDHPYAQ